MSGGTKRYVTASEKSTQLAKGTHLRAVLMDSTPNDDAAPRRAWNEWAAVWPELAPLAVEYQNAMMDRCIALRG